MPRQRTHYSRRTYVVSDDFQEQLRRFQEESGLSWSEIARRLGTYRHTVGRWWKAGVQPNQHHMKALLALADDFGLSCLFTDDRGNQETRTSAVTVAVAAIPNSAATGAPTISGTAQVGQMLNASTSNISDSDGLANATFTYQWIAFRRRNRCRGIQPQLPIHRRQGEPGDGRAPLP